MTQDEQTLLMFKGIVAELPEQSRTKVEHCIACLLYTSPSPRDS